MRIEVTQQDVLHGRPQRCHACPVALAVTRQAFGLEGLQNPHKRVAVVGNGILIDGKMYEPRPFASYKKFLFLFDNFGDAQPFEFEIDYERT